jgi:MoaA/NifB/PqqE/SkfB family radical SAM enzyme
MILPHPSNFCAGYYSDWLEVNLTEKCNASCEWCLGRDGYRPQYHAPKEEMLRAILESDKNHILLLGGEPLLYRDLGYLIKQLKLSNRKTYLTTNGFLLSKDYVLKNLVGLTGINISIHHYDMMKNREITGILVDEEKLKESVEFLVSLGIDIRINCNIIKGMIDSSERCYKFIAWMKLIGINNVRFGELKLFDQSFVDLAKIFNYKHGLTDNPYLEGCNKDCVINDVFVNFRQMCGLQTKFRSTPAEYKKADRQVLYYDGKFYHGWQEEDRENDMTKKSNDRDENIKKLLKKITDEKLTEEEIKSILDLIDTLIQLESKTETIVEHHYHESSSHC